MGGSTSGRCCAIFAMTSRTPLFILLVSFVLTALQGCGADCRAALEESGLAYEKDGEKHDADKECTMSGGGGGGTEAPGRLLDDSMTPDSWNELVGIEHLNKYQKMQAQARRAMQEMEVHGRALAGHEMDPKAMQEALKDTCKQMQKVIDCHGGKDQALCACTCKELADPDDEDDPECKFPCGDDDKEEEMPDITMKEIIECLFIDAMKDSCKDAEGIDNSLSNPCS